MKQQQEGGGAKTKPILVVACVEAVACAPSKFFFRVRRGRRDSKIGKLNV
jgi:hypothetical protein